MIRIITMFLSFITLGSFQLATITMTNVDEYTYETQDGITLMQLFGEEEFNYKPNLFDLENITLLAVGGGSSYTISENNMNIVTTGVGGFYNSNAISVEPNTTYYINYDDDDIDDGSYIRIYQNNDVNDTLKQSSGFFNSGDNTTLGIYFRNNNEGTVNYTNIQLEKGSYATEYFPYGENKVCTKELEDNFNNIDNWTVTNATTTLENDGVTITKSSTAVGGIYQSLDFNPNDYYYISINYDNLTSSNYLFGRWNYNQMALLNVLNTETHYTNLYNSSGNINTNYGFFENSSATSSIWINDIVIYNPSKCFGKGNEPTETELNTWYDLYETAITTDQHEYTYTINTIELEDIIILASYMAIWIFSYKLLRWWI